MKLKIDIEKVSITAPNHGGYVELIYFDGILVSYNSINITGNFRKWYLKHIPVNLNDLNEFALTYKPNRIQVLYCDVEFEVFWEQYNNKINAKRCIPIWKKIGRKKRLLAHYRIWEYDYYLSQKGIAKLNPENYLKDERFNDEAW